MNQVRQNLARWTAKVLSSTKTKPAPATETEFHLLDTAQLRKVTGGTDSSTQLPKGTW